MDEVINLNTSIIAAVLGGGLVLVCLIVWWQHRRQHKFTLNVEDNLRRFEQIAKRMMLQNQSTVENQSTASSGLLQETITHFKGEFEQMLSNWQGYLEQAQQQIDSPEASLPTTLNATQIAEEIGDRLQAQWQMPNLTAEIQPQLEQMQAQWQELFTNLNQDLQHLKEQASAIAPPSGDAQASFGALVQKIDGYEKSRKLMASKVEEYIHSKADELIRGNQSKMATLFQQQQDTLRQTLESPLVEQSQRVGELSGQFSQLSQQQGVLKDQLIEHYQEFKRGFESDLHGQRQQLKELLAQHQASAQEALSQSGQSLLESQHAFLEQIRENLQGETSKLSELFTQASQQQAGLLQRLTELPTQWEDLWRSLQGEQQKVLHELAESYGPHHQQLTASLQQQWHSLQERVQSLLEQQSKKQQNLLEEVQGVASGMQSIWQQSHETHQSAVKAQLQTTFKQLNALTQSTQERLESLTHSQENRLNEVNSSLQEYQGQLSQTGKRLVERSEVLEKTVTGFQAQIDSILAEKRTLEAELHQLNEIRQNHLQQLEAGEQQQGELQQVLEEQKNRLDQILEERKLLKQQLKEGESTLRQKDKLISELEEELKRVAQGDATTRARRTSKRGKSTRLRDKDMLIDFQE